MHVALTFPGQGSQLPGMGAEWSDSAEWSIVESADRHLEANGARGSGSVSRLLLDADAETLRRTENAQIATFVVSMMAYERIRPLLEGHEVVAMCGHSLGEYSALAAAGAIPVTAGFGLVAARGAAMRDAAAAREGTMAAVLGLEPDQVEKALDQVDECWVANLNGPGNVIITGSISGVAAGAEAVKAAGARRVLPLQVGGAFHSPLMAPAAEALSRALAAAPWQAVRVPVVCNVDALPHTDPADWSGLLARQLTAPVRWTDTLATLDRLGVDAVVELGPGAVLTGIAKRALPGVIPVSVQGPNDAANFGGILQGE